MHLIVKISIDDKERFVSSELAEHTNLGIASALILLENSVRAYVRTEVGSKAAEDMKVITVLSWNQVAEPLVDGMLVYRLETDPHKLHVYQKVTKIVPGYVYGQSVASTFNKVKIFELVDYKKIGSHLRKDIVNSESIPAMEMVFVGPARIAIPKAMTISPMCDVIKQLTLSPAFLNRRKVIDQNFPDEEELDQYESEPIIVMKPESVDFNGIEIVDDN